MWKLITRELIEIGIKEDFLSERPGGAFDGHCHHRRAREIGEKLNAIAGMDLMWKVFYRVRRKAGKQLSEHLGICLVRYRPMDGITNPSLQGRKMKSNVYYGSPRQALLEANETLPAKLDLIIEKLNIRDRVKNESVVIKMHTGNNICYSTIHPVFVRKLVKAVKDGGGKPFIADVSWDVEGAETRGYTAEVLGCPIYPAAGPKDGYSYPHQRTFKNMNEWKLAGMIQDASFLDRFFTYQRTPELRFWWSI